MRKFSDESCREVTPSPSKIALYEVIWKNMLDPHRPSPRRRYDTVHALCEYLGLQTHSEYVIRIAFLQQQWLHCLAY